MQHVRVAQLRQRWCPKVSRADAERQAVRYCVVVGPAPSLRGPLGGNTQLVRIEPEEMRTWTAISIRLASASL
jgi:hypothetical protein